MEAGTSDVDVPSSWWGDNWVNVVAGVTLVAGVVLSLIPGTQGLGIGLLVAGSKAAISGAIVGGVIGGLSSVVTGNDSLQGLSSGAIDGLLSGFVLGSVLYAGGVAYGAMRARVPGTKGQHILSNTKYTEKVIKQMSKKSDLYHSFPSMIDDMAGMYGYIGKFVGNDGIVRTAVELPGAINGTTGWYQYIIEPNGIIVKHRKFETLKTLLGLIK
jgi:hypothetical protein